MLISDDDKAGPSSLCDDDNMTPSATSVDMEFQAAQSTDPTLEPTHCTLAVKKDVIVDESRARRLPHFEQVRGVLWHQKKAEGRHVDN